jgi:hypothetical protein
VWELLSLLQFFLVLLDTRVEGLGLLLPAGDAGLVFADIYLVLSNFSEKLVVSQGVDLIHGLQKAIFG